MSSVIAPSIRTPGSDQAAESSWDQHLLSAGGHMLQSWNWGEMKRGQGWQVERVAVFDGPRKALAQILFRHKGPVSVGYIPRGPAFSHPDADLARRLFEGIDRVSRDHRALFTMVEPNQALPFTGTFRGEGFVRGQRPFQPARTVKVPLLPDDELLGQMHQKTRYSVRLAERRGVTVARVDHTAANIDRFYDLLRDTSQRNAFGIHSRDYYADFLSHFGESALLLLAFAEDRLAAGLIAARFGDEAIYMYGGSSTQHRAHGAAFALQFEAMRWARAAGCMVYDLWGIPEQDPDAKPSDDGKIAGSRGDDWHGLYCFKVGFGGDIVRYPTTLERRYHPLLAFIARRVYANRD